jgi:hypothetical protein
VTEKQLRTIYQTACDGKSFEPNEGQFKVWKQVLGWAEEKDLARALIFWFTDQTGFPMPADLKPLIEQARRERIAKASTPQVQKVWECLDCHTTVSSFDENWIPTMCKGIRALPMKDPDYGAKCNGREFKLRFEFDARKHVQELAR